ncbi:MAG: serine/threonine protein kinase, partial [Gemmatimonadaceae bacterium]|nr:serine/threonine protein kinase [Gemmatimonadaceae bacterium]
MTTTTTIDRIRLSLRERYALERELGRGGMGTVYLARDLRLDRPVALKVLLPEFASQSGLRDRFLQETRTAASFSHPNIVPVYAVEEGEDYLAYAMGLVEGETLTQRVARAGPLPVRELVRVVQDVGYALAYAHGRGVVHRDIKPDNVMLERATGRALVLDFGISRSMTHVVSASNLTRVGEVVGTPEYMSPEQASGDVVDGRSDLYALGLTAYYAATGTTAMSGESSQKILVRQLTERSAPLMQLRPDLPPALAGAIDRCMEKDPAARFPTAEALVEEIDAAQLAEPEIPLPIRLFAGELSALSLAFIGILVITWLMVRMQQNARMALLDTLLPVVGLLAVLFARTLTTMSEGRRL